VDFAPAVDIEEKADHFLVSADLPGVSEKDIEVKVQDGVLLLSGKRESSKEQKTESGFYRERSYGSFCRSITLGEGVDAAKIEAAYKNGVLTVKLPKKEEAKPRQIPVSAS
jgi:HSP20 family protein